jgi:signal transduction histidine kinase
VSDDRHSWSLRRRLARFLVGLGAAVVALIVIAIVLLLQVRAQQRQVINRYFTAVTNGNQYFLQQVNAETAIRGYALSHLPVTLTPARTFTSPAYHADYLRLRTLLAGDPTALAALGRWDTATHAWYQQWGKPVIIEAKAGTPIPPQQVLAGKTLFDANRQAYVSFDSDLVARRNGASSALSLRTTLLFIAVIVTAAGVGLAGIALWFALRRWVIAPLGSLAEEARTVRAGELGHEVSVHGPGEITTLATDVDSMRAVIVDQLAEVERARSEIEASRLVLQTQAEDLSRSNRDLEQFAYVASHDLQEPLRKVASFCQMLERRYAGQLDERADQYIAFAVDGAKRMQQLINDLLAFSRVGRSSQDLVDVDLADCLAAARQNLPSIEANDARITSDPLPHVQGERSLLVQLFQNLIGNAVKFRGSEPPQIHVGAVSRGEAWEFSVSDNGIGIEPQYAERIFVIFQRLHGKDEYAGTGIGLSLCKRIVEHHGGQIWLDTSQPTGATFRWTLPAVVPTVEDTVSETGDASDDLVRTE